MILFLRSPQSLIGSLTGITRRQQGCLVSSSFPAPLTHRYHVVAAAIVTG